MLLLVAAVVVVVVVVVVVIVEVLEFSCLRAWNQSGCTLQRTCTLIPTYWYMLAKSSCACTCVRHINVVISIS